MVQPARRARFRTDAVCEPLDARTGRVRGDVARDSALADEWVTGVDRGGGRQVADLLFRTAAERDMTLVLVTHDPALAARCTRQVAMRSGRIESAEAAMAVVA